MNCLACDRIEQIKQNKNPRFIVELSQSYVVLGDEQFYRGWCVLLFKQHHEQLPQLPVDQQRELWNDVAAVAGAVYRELKPVRINYECLGNQLHHIHWHIIPRFADDPDSTQPVWLRPAPNRRGSLSAADEKKLIAQLSSAIQG